MAARRSLTLQDMQELARQHGGECLSTEYLNVNKTKLRWRCSQGHEWEALPSSIMYQKTWCLLCTNENARIGLQEMRELARNRGGACLSTEYVNIRVKLRWRCSKGHEWEAPARHIRRGEWCPDCSWDRFTQPGTSTQRLTLRSMQQLARQHGGRCLSTEYINTRTQLRWRCSEGHEWNAAPRNIREGSWCPVCPQSGMRKTLEDMQELARQHGGECLSTEYINKETKLRWKCSEGHEWETAPNHVRRGTWCPICANERKKN